MLILLEMQRARVAFAVEWRIYGGQDREGDCRSWHFAVCASDATAHNSVALFHANDIPHLHQTLGSHFGTRNAFRVCNSVSVTNGSWMNCFVWWGAYAVDEVEHGKSERRCGFRHSELGLPWVRRKNGWTRPRVQVSGRMSDRLAPDLGSSHFIRARSRLSVARSL